MNKFKRGHEYRTPFGVASHHAICIKDGDRNTARFAHVCKNDGSIRVGEGTFRDISRLSGMSMPWQEKVSRVHRMFGRHPEQVARSAERDIGRVINYSALPIPGIGNRDNCDSWASSHNTGMRVSTQSLLFYAAVGMTPYAIDYTAREVRNFLRDW